MTSLWSLLSCFLQIGFFSIGGGYAVIPLIQRYVVERAGWISLREFADIVAISQMTPGPLAVNASTFVGMRVAGIPGAVAATFGCVFSGLIVAFLLDSFFGRHRANPRALAVLAGLKSASIGLIAAAAALILVFALRGSPDVGAGGGIVAFVLFLVVFAAARTKRLHPTLLLLLAGCAGILVYR